ncbi:leucine-rich repeat domain-containing protein [Marinoscillum sp.]|uniref:leucine-rich repeat domain-containing protein n=1 Tax=Marinoscillum sp. TaxID=2024838 RepID=UPI003BACAD1F
MKKFTTNLIAFVLVCTGIIVQAQELKKSSAVDSVEIQQRRTPQQTSLTEPSIKSTSVDLSKRTDGQLVEATSGTANYEKAHVPEHRMNFQQMVDAFMSRQKGGLPSQSSMRTAAKAQFAPEIKEPQKQEHSYEEVDDVKELKLRLHEQNKAMQERAIANRAASRRPIEMGDQKGLNTDVEKKPLDKTHESSYQLEEADRTTIDYLAIQRLKSKANSQSMEELTADEQRLLSLSPLKTKKFTINSASKMAKAPDEGISFIPGLSSHLTTVSTDSMALVAIYDALGGDFWFDNSGWKIDDVENWVGVETRAYEVEIGLDSMGAPVYDTLNFVVGLNLQNNNLNGTIPFEIGDLDSLEYIEFNDNYITGSIPSEIGNLTKLNSLSLGANFIDFVPDEIGFLTNLTNLSLWNSEYDDSDIFVTDGITSLPEGIGALTNLTSLDLGGNALTTLPDTIGALVNLEYLYLWGNDLTSLPASIGNFSTLFGLYLGGNQLTTLPTEIGDLTSMYDLYVDYNQLTSIPASIGNCTNLSFLLIAGNQLSDLPNELSGLSNLYSLDMQNNLFSTLPTGVAGLTGLYELNAPENNIISLPDMSSMTNLRVARFWGNSIANDFSVFTVLDSIEILDLYNNQITGTLTGIGNLTKLRELYMGENFVTGEVPAEISNCTELWNLAIENNELSGMSGELFELTTIQNINLRDNLITTFPATAGSSSLFYIGLEFNRITSIPASIGTFPNLQVLRLDGNNITGTIPVELANDTSLIELYLQENQITGAIPAELGSVTSLVYINVSVNELNEPLPSELGNLSNLYLLAVDENQIPGDIPTSFSNLSSLGALFIQRNQLENLPDLSGLSSLGEVYGFDNYFEFDDIEPLLQTPAYTLDFYPQYTPDAELGIYNLGEPVTLDATVGGAANTYQWYFNGNYLDGKNDPQLTIANLQLDSTGTYWCLIGNDSVNAVTFLELESGDKSVWTIAPADESDSLALVDIYKATRGQYWNHAGNWMNAPLVMWEGVILNGAGRVTRLDLYDQNMDGGLPPSIGDLDALEWLAIWGNPGLRYLPGELYGLSNLHYLDMDGIGIDELSPAIGLLTNLDTLWLGGNSFSELPDELYNLTNLKLLGIYNLQLFEVPQRVTELTNLELLYLQNNANMVGELPSNIGDLTNLTYLSLANNPGVTGALPSSISNLTNLEFLFLDNSRFTSGYEHVGSLTGLKRLSVIRVPAMDGGLPDSYANLTNLENFVAGFSDFSSGFPTEILSMTSLKVLQIPEANLTGAVPAGLGNMDSLYYLNLRNNDLTGALPSELNQHLQYIYLQENELTDISALALDTAIIDLALQGNRLDFQDLLPFEMYFEEINLGQRPGFYDVSYMKPTNQDVENVILGVGDDYTMSMDIDTDTLTYIDWYLWGSYVGSGDSYTIANALNPDNDGDYIGYSYHDVISNLTGLQIETGIFSVNVVEPVNIADSSALVTLYAQIQLPSGVDLNWFEGPVETWDGVFAYGGNVVGLSVNEVYAETFPDLSALTNLEMLDVYNSNFNGSSLPASLFSLSNLFSINILQSNVGGPIPSEIGNATSLGYLDLSGNFLTGDIPSSLSNLTNLYYLNLSTNRLTGSIPSGFVTGQFSSFYVDRNYLTGLASDLDSAVYYANVNVSYNNFDFAALSDGIGNIGGFNVSLYPQGTSREITFSGDPTVGGEVTLSAERQDPADEFYWYRSDKNNAEPYFFEIGYTGNDSSYTFTINEDYDVTKYMAMVVNPNYQYGEAPFLTKQIAVDSYDKRYATSQQSPAFDDPGTLGFDPNGPVGMPDNPPQTMDGSYGYSGAEWYYYDKWWHNANEPDFDTLKMFYATDPIAINYIRLHSPGAELNIGNMIIHGTGGEEIIVPVNREIYNYENQITFPKTPFAVDQVDFVVSNGSVDAIEIGDTGSDELGAPFINSPYAGGPNTIWIDVQYDGFANSFVIERSTDGVNFEVQDTIYFRGWYSNPVTEPGNYYYRAKALLSAFGEGLESNYSDIIFTGSCEPTIPVGQSWAGTYEILDGPDAGLTGGREVQVDQISYNLFNISDVLAGYYQDVFGEFVAPREFLQVCDSIIPKYGFNAEILGMEYTNDTLYVEFSELLYGATGLSKFWPTSSTINFDLQNPEYLTASLLSSDSIMLTWEYYGSGDPSFILQQSVGNPTSYTTLDTISGAYRYTIENTLDGQRYYYRVIAMESDSRSFPSNEPNLIHKSPLFDPLYNRITSDITRTSYGGAWGDYDRDGDDDLYVSNAFDLAANFMYENNGDGTFKKIVGTIATTEIGFNRTAAWGDYDNDGFLDLYVPGSRDFGDRVYRNTGSRSFEITNTQVSEEFHFWSPSEAGVWVDVNNDGFLDLAKSIGTVYHNDGAGQLVLADTLYVDNTPLTAYEAYFWTISNVDIDNDNDQDLYITSDVQNMLFINDGSGNYTYQENSFSNPGVRSRGYTWSDFNNDGWIDLITGDQYDETLGLYVNRGDGTFDFIPVWSVLGIVYNANSTDIRFGRGYTSGDLNNDGRVDLIWTVNDRAYPAMNQGNLRFKIIFEKDQAFPITNNFSHVSIADIDNDGFQDIFFPNQSFTGGNYIYRNNANSNNWLTVRLKGIQSNSYGIGSKVGVKSNGKWQYQLITTQNGISSGNSLAAEFGLGSAITADSVMVQWPSGLITYDTAKASNQAINMVEVPQSSGPTVNATDSLALVALYDSTNGDGWLRNEGWREGSPLEWEGTFFTPNGRLISVVLNDNNLTGVIPPAIATLDTLQILDLSNNNLTGKIPEQLGNISTLINLSLNDNQLEGTIPASVGSLSRLENLDLYNNAFIGELPATLGGLTNLKQFEIYNNGFNGFVPAEIGTLSNLQILRLDQNDFEGPLPAGLGAMSSLRILAINDNHLTEGIPAELSQLSELLELRAHNNEFNGELPTELADLTGIEVIDISNNMLTGSLAPFANLDSMRYINASGNRFVDLTDFSGNTADSIIVTNNSLDFGDFELNNALIDAERLFITPQDSLFERVDSLHAAAVPLEIYFEVGGSFNSYLWTFNGDTLESSSGVDVFDNQVIINSPDSQHEGDYVLTITNSNYPGTVIATYPFNLKIESLERDKRALLAFLAATNGGEFPYNPSGWSADAELVDGTDTWEGVTVAGGRVTELILPAVIDTDLTDGNQSRILDGQVPLSFADLSGLVTVNLKDNYLRAFPNVSQWQEIDTIDISNNRLAFKDIIPNVKMPINYAPQRRYDITKYDTIAAGNNYIVSINMSGTGLQYQWQFGPFVPGQPFNNNVSPIQGANSRVYTVEAVNYAKMGTYRVDITHPLVPNLTITSRNRNLMAKTDVFGTVFADDQGTLLTDGEVITYRIRPGAPFVPEDTVNLDGGGVYQFKDVILGDFVVLVAPDRTVYPLSEEPGSSNVIKTYYEQAETDTAATTLEVRERVTGIDIQMLFYNVADVATNGATFNGLVESDFKEDSVVDEENSNGRISARRKVKRAACSIRRFVPKGRNGQDEEGTYELYAYVESNDEGEFVFSNIEEGKYRLSIEYPGVPMDPDSDIFFEVGGDKENQEFQIKATITEEGITVESKEILYTLKPYIKDVQLYPNPTMGKMTADFLVYRKLKDLKLEVMDSRGVFLFEKELSPRLGTQRVQVDLTDYRSGVYFLTFTDDSGTFRQQIKISKQ